MKKKVLGVIGSYLLIYLFLFILIPVFYDISINPNLREIGFIVHFITILFILAGMLFFTDNLLIWFSCIFFYILLLGIYIPKEIYGIGTWGLFNNSYYAPDIVWLGVLILILVTLFWELVVWMCIKIIKRLNHNNHKV